MNITGKYVGIWVTREELETIFCLDPISAVRRFLVAGTVIGWASAIFGIGGGSLTVPFLNWRSVPMQQAVATSAACGLPIAIAGAISFMVVGMDAPHLPAWSVGYVYLPAVVGIALTSMFFARFGATLAHRLSPLMLKRLFAVLLVCVGTNFLI